MFSDRTESFKRLLVETGGVEVEFLEPAIPDFIKDVNDIVSFEYKYKNVQTYAFCLACTFVAVETKYK